MSRPQRNNNLDYVHSLIDRHPSSGYILTLTGGHKIVKQKLLCRILYNKYLCCGRDKCQKSNVPSATKIHWHFGQFWKFWEKVSDSFVPRVPLMELITKKVLAPFWKLSLFYKSWYRFFAIHPYVETVPYKRLFFKYQPWVV